MLGIIFGVSNIAVLRKLAQSGEQWKSLVSCNNADAMLAAVGSGPGPVV